MAFLHHAPADLLNVAAPPTLVFPEKHAGHVFWPTPAEPKDLTRQAINSRLRSLWRLKNFASFASSPSCRIEIRSFGVATHSCLAMEKMLLKAGRRAKMQT